jgi:hypothetical protein
MLEIILEISLVILFVALIAIIVDLIEYLFNEVEYANGIITFNEYIENWQIWQKHTFLGKLIDWLWALYFKIK